ncbi:MAG: NAD(P)H-binding protein [Loktanella sp.]|nr:NAD(P)H-binding protein [Loktanella sp.]
MNILLAGATGTIGQAVADTLLSQGHDVICAVRPGSSLRQSGLRTVECQLTKTGSLTDALKSRPVNAVVSCMATRSGAADDAWAVEHDAQSNLMTEAAQAGAGHFVLVSAICVQKPVLAFQHAKRAFEDKLMQSGLDWSIVRPTAFFKSLSGQVARVQGGKPFLVFGDGLQTACKPISDRDLARFVVSCLSDPEKRNTLLPIGGPGPAITPLDQAAQLFALLGQPPRIRHVPLALMNGLVGTFSLLGHASKRMRDKAEFARTGRYYATESMLLWDAEQGGYDADATPEFGTDTLWDHYAKLIAGEAKTDLGAHAVF